MNKIVKLQGKLENPRNLLSKIGAELVATSQKAFKEERMGAQRWDARYPKQSPPKINVAGVVQDLSSGSAVKTRRFLDRPVLQDTGQLKASVHSTITGPYEVEAFSVKEYGGLHQYGGVSKQKITDTVKKNLAKFLKTQAGKARRLGRHVLIATGIPKGRALKEMSEKLGSERGKELRKKLGFLFSITELRTKIFPRPFLGIPPETEGHIKELVQEELGK